MERRLSAVLISDVVGYTKLMEFDTEGTVKAWSDARDNVIEPVISGANGRIVKFTGDGFLAEFNTVQVALESAIEIQSRLKEATIKFRMAINLGDIIDDGKDIHGEGVNIAARLETLCEPGGICISGDAHNQVKNRVSANYNDLGLREVKNVSEPVRAFLIRADDFPTQNGPVELNIKEKASIAVLPFDNMSNDPDQEYFSDGMTEDIITELSHLRWLDVIARNSSFSYKGKSPDIRQVSSELGARYVLEGSVRKAAGRIRVNAQLLEGSSGAHIWADRYDRELDDIFELQDELTSSVLGAIEPSLRLAEIDRAKRVHPKNLDAHDLYLQALPHIYAFNPSDNKEALRLLQQAIELEPNYPEALAFTAWAYEQRFNHGWEPFSGDDVESAVEYAHQTINTSSEDPIVLACAGFVLVAANQDVAFGTLTLKRALANNPNIGFVSMLCGAGLLYSGGNDAEALECFLTTMKFSPKDPLAFANLANLGAAYAELGDLEQAEYFCRKSIELFPSWDTGIYYLISVLVQKDDIEEARKNSELLLKIDQNYSVEKFDSAFRINNQSLKGKIIYALKKVGIPQTT